MLTDQGIERQLAELTAWWLRRMALAQAPLPEKVTFRWHNHFATAASKVPIAAMPPVIVLTDHTEEEPPSP